MSPQTIQGQEMFTGAIIAISSSGGLDGRRHSPDADDDFSHAPYFKFNDGKVKFDTNDVDNAHDNYGSASGVCPKSPLNTKGATSAPFAIYSI